jgi:hypothetical protein
MLESTFYANAYFSVEPIFLKYGKPWDKATTGLILKQKKKNYNYKERGGERIGLY